MKRKRMQKVKHFPLIKPSQNPGNLRDAHNLNSTSFEMGFDKTVATPISLQDARTFSSSSPVITTTGKLWPPERSSLHNSMPPIFGMCKSDIHRSIVSLQSATNLQASSPFLAHTTVAIGTRYRSTSFRVTASSSTTTITALDAALMICSLAEVLLVFSRSRRLDEVLLVFRRRQLVI
jgi:hypothetical protein